MAGRDRADRRQALVRGLDRHLGLILLAALGVYGAYLSTQALAGRRLPDVETVNIAAPFAAGTYLVAHGGSTETVNAHLHTLGHSVDRFRPWRGQSLALDIIRITPWAPRSRFVEASPGDVSSR